MDPLDVDRITTWLIDRGIAGDPETVLLHGFAGLCRRAGLEVSRALVLIDTLHPSFEGRAFRWRADGVEEVAVIEYGRTNQGGENAENWQRSAYYHLWTSGDAEIRRRLITGEALEFLHLEQLRADGETDFVAMVQRFAIEGAIGEMDAVFSHWTSRRAAGFTDDELAALRRLVPVLALAMKSAALAQVAKTLVQVYLGRDAGARVLRGRILRGVADRIGAVLWFSDLRGYTGITDTAPPDEIIPLLNDYADVVISAIHEAGGEVLKLMGDGTLAIFQAADPGEACRAALRAEAGLRVRERTLNARRAAGGQPVTSVYLGLHIGEVFYGNIGSEDRLDFTVVGPAVNEVSRIASMCRSVDRGVVMSSDFADATPADERAGLVSVGRYALRGVSRAQELFTRDPGRCEI